MKTRLLIALLSFAALVGARAQVPPYISYQGRITVTNVNYRGIGQFKFALVNGTGDASYWSNDGTNADGGEPAGAVNLIVNQGLYATLLGSGTHTIPATVFNNSDVWLRVWFRPSTNDGLFQLLSPDLRLVSAPYAFKAQSVVPGAIDETALQNGAVTSAKIASGAVTPDKLGPISQLSAPDGTPNDAVRVDNDGDVFLQHDLFLANGDVRLPNNHGVIIGDSSALIGNGQTAHLRANNILLQDPTGTQIKLGVDSTGNVAIKGDLTLTEGSNISAHGVPILARNPVETYLRGNSIAFQNDSLSRTMMYIATDGDVGIGTTSPEQSLHVNGGSRLGPFTIGADAPSADFPFEYETIGLGVPGYNFRLQSLNGFVFHTGPSLLDRMLIHGNGNVGIGTTAPQAKLHVEGDVKVQGTLLANQINSVNNVFTTFRAPGIDFDLSPNGGGRLRFVSSPGDNSIYIEAFDSMGVGSANALFLTGANALPIQSYFVQANGSHFSGDLIVASAFSASSITSQGNIHTTDGGFVLGDPGDTDGKVIRSNGRLHIQSTENIFLNPSAGSGEVVVGGGGGNGNMTVSGNLSVSSGLLVGGDIRASASISAPSIVAGSGGFKFPDGTIQQTAAGAGGGVQGGGTFGYVPRFTANTQVGNSAIFAAADGNIGIGTDAPEAKLQVIGGGARLGNFALSTDGSGIDFDFPYEYETIGLTADSMNFRLQSPNSIIFHTGPGFVQSMIITDSGMIGVGTDTPEALLDVRGEARLEFISADGISANGISAESLNVTDFSQFDGGLYVANSFGGDAIYADGDIRTTGDVNVEGSLNVDNNTSILGSLDVFENFSTSSIEIEDPDLNLPAFIDLHSPPGANLDFSIRLITGDYFGRQDGRWLYLLAGDGAARFRVEGQVSQSGSDIAEMMPAERPETILPGSVVSIDPDKVGAVRLARRAYDQAVVGIVSGANGLEAGNVLQLPENNPLAGQTPVALAGRVWCLADAKYGSIHPGDLLTSSDTPGYAMKVGDVDRARAAIVGKAMSALEAGQGFILVFVRPQ